MYILGIIERQIERLQEVSADADYSQLMPIDALETEIKVSEEIRKLICMHNAISNQKVKEDCSKWTWIDFGQNNKNGYINPDTFKLKMDVDKICESINSANKGVVQMSIKNRANELIDIAKKIAAKENIDLEDYSEANKSRVIEVWNKATKEFENRLTKLNN